MRAILMLCFLCVFVCSAKDYVDKLDCYIISCHTTDFECFKKCGNDKLAIDEYEPLYVEYGNTGTCIRISGMEESELTGIGMESDMCSLTLELPLRVQQVNNDTIYCAKPERAFEDIETGSGFLHEADLKKFPENAFEDIETGSGFLHEADLKKFPDNAFEDIETGSGFLHEPELKKFTGNAFEDIETGSGFLHEADLKKFPENAFEDIETGSGFIHEAELKKFTVNAFEDIETGSGFIHEAELKKFTVNAFEDIETGSGFLHEADLKKFPENAFEDIETGSGFLHEAELKKFTGNATIQVIFPYEMRKKKSMIHMTLLEEDLDVVFDIPEYMDYHRNNTQEQEQVELSEWAYGVVQHIDGAKDFALPYTKRFRYLHDSIPIERLIMLYPEEGYTDLDFLYK